MAIFHVNLAGGMSWVVRIIGFSWVSIPWLAKVGSRQDSSMPRCAISGIARLPSRHSPSRWGW